MRSYPGASGGRMAHILVVFSLSLLLLGLLALPDPSPSLATTDYTVNTTDDDVDAGGCEPAPGDCTLREAINAANTDGDVSNIAFNIPLGDGGYNPSTGVWTIQLTSNLPAITDDGTGIMGSTQTGNQGDKNLYGPEIAVNGGSLYQCFEIQSAYNTINGLVINQCGLPGGIEIEGSNAHHNSITGNYIGINAQGTAPLANYHGISIWAPDNTIGGTTPAERNVISGNQYYGVLIGGTGTKGNIISGNYIGTSANGNTSVPNGLGGVYIFDGAQSNTIGPNNIIAYNNVHGVHVVGATTTGNTITQNSIHSNGGEGIALTNGNNNMAHPDLTAADCISVTGMTMPGGTVEVFSDADGEGQFYEEGTFSWVGMTFTFTLDSGIFRGPKVTATVTDPSTGDTSPFSEPIDSGCQYIYLPLIMKNYTP